MTHEIGGKKTCHPSWKLKARKAAAPSSRPSLTLSLLLSSLLRFSRLCPSIHFSNWSCLPCRFHAFIFSPFIHHSLTLSFQSGLNRIFLSSTSPSHTSPIWLPFCPWRSLHTSTTAFCVCVSVSSHLLYTEYQSPHSSWKEGHGYFKGQFEG